MIQDIKIWKHHFEAVNCGVKTAEIRQDDRDYAVWDTLILREYDNDDFTGRKLYAIVTHLVNDTVRGIEDGYVMLSFKLIGNEGRIQ